LHTLKCYVVQKTLFNVVIINVIKCEENLIYCEIDNYVIVQWLTNNRLYVLTNYLL